MSILFNKKSLRSDFSGFTLVEVLVAAGILSVVLLGVSSAIYYASKSQQNQQTKIESNDMFAGFAKYLLSRDGCEATFRTRVLPAADTNFSVTGFGGFGRNTSPISSGYVIDQKLRVTRLTWSQKAAAAATTVGVTTTPLTRKVARITFQYALTEAGSTQARNLKSRIIDIPVLVNGANVVQACDLDLTNQSMCQSIGMQWNAGASACEPNASCESKGNYIVYDWGGDPEAREPQKNAVRNPLTNAFSCPAGSTAIRTYIDTWNNSVTLATGKKTNETFTAVMQEEYFTCLDCP